MIFSDKADEGPTIAIYDITFVSEIQLRREIDDRNTILEGIHHGRFDTDGRAKPNFRNLFPSIPGIKPNLPSFYFSAAAQKIVKYNPLTTTISQTQHVEAVQVVPLIFGNMGGCHPATLEALAHHPLGKGSRDNVVPDFPKIPHKIPRTAREIIELTFDEAINALKTWQRFRIPHLGAGTEITDHEVFG